MNAELLGHVFQRPELLQRALTHRSYSHEADAGARHNEQLEFLGDAVLGFVASAKLAETFPDASEGQLSKWKAHLVSARHLHDVALKLHLGDHLRLGPSEENSGGRLKRAKLADALEAVIAALYLDGGIVAAGRFVERHILGDDLAARVAGIGSDNYKTMLQELTQARHTTAPEYRVAEERGPAHRKTFVVEVWLGKERIAAAEGSTKKSAEQAAARAGLEQIGGIIS